MGEIRQKQTETAVEGVRVRSSSVFIDFRWNGDRYREKSSCSPTQEGIKAAARIRSKIVSEIDLGLFGPEKFIEYFPNSKRAKEFRAVIDQKNDDIPTFAEVAAEAMAIKANQVSPESLQKLKGYLNVWWMPYLAGLKITEIDEDLLENLDADLAWKTEKTRSNALAPLRFVFSKAMRKRILVDGVKTALLTLDPTAVLTNGKVSKPIPDPFEPAERDRILQYLSTLPDRESIWHHYFTVAFWTGMRTNELLGLEWEQIDFGKQLIRVDRAMVNGKVRLETKTGVARDVPMLPPVETALKAMKSHTFLNGQHVFASPRYINRPLWGPKAPNDAFQFALKKLGIRQRRTYNTRHTFATQMLMDNVKPGFAAKVMGHSLMVFFSTYAKWLESEDVAFEMSKISVPDGSQIGAWSQSGHK